ncbi:MAG: ornithine carbamoyltransferase [Phycisphaerales bacterium]|nr:ornithine carbamoyltransferase [Phycisphaerales bacterium]
MLHTKNLLAITDLAPDELTMLLDTAASIKRDPSSHADTLRGASVILLFEKPSLRTRISFEVGVTRLGGHAIYMDHSGQRLGERETVADYARNLERWVHAIVARVFTHGTVRELAQWSSVPVINGLCDLHHPCQALADMLTLREHKGDLRGLRLAYVGDGNNVCHSLMQAAAMCGTSATIVVPEGCEPDATIVREAQTLAAESGSTIAVTNDPAAVAGHDAIYTDVWISMGADPADEAERKARLARFAPYQVNAELMSRAAPDAVFMHCLPAKRGLEVTDEVIESAASVVFDQAENRLHAQNAVLIQLVETRGRRPAASARQRAST